MTPNENPLIDHMFYGGEPSQDEPTIGSIAAALEAQRRERAAFTHDTGVLLDRNGQLLRSSIRSASESDRRRHA